MDRTPPWTVVEKLRREVNFGCPVHDCGIPYLTVHHFDPPFHVRQHHDPQGMVALCPTHASLADGGRWTKEQIREMKRKPFVQHDQITDFYGYLRKNVVCVIGNVAYDVRNVLEMNGERVIGFEKDADGYDRLNLLIRDVKGSPVLVMDNNFWTAYGKELHDLVCSARGKELRIIAKDRATDLSMRFHDYPVAEFRELLLKGLNVRRIPEWLDEHTRALLKGSWGKTDNVDSFIQAIGEPETIPTWLIKGRLSWGTTTLEIRDFEIEDERHNIYGMNFIVGSRAAFSFSSGSTAIGTA